MKKFFSRLTLCFSLCLLFSAADASEAAMRLANLLRTFNTYSANFSQVTSTEQGALIQRSHGKIMIKHPGKFRWESLSPTHQILVTDGKVLWTYDVDLAQATRQLLTARTTVDPAAILSGSVKNIERGFQVAESRAGDQLSFTLIPKVDNAGFIKATLNFKNNELISMRVLNNLNQSNQFNFSQRKINQPIPESLFNFKPPKNVDVIAQ